MEIVIISYLNIIQEEKLKLMKIMRKYFMISFIVNVIKDIVHLILNIIYQIQIYIVVIQKNHC